MSKKKQDKVEMVEHIITQEDLDANPELVLDGVEVGDVVEIPKDEDAEGDKDPAAGNDDDDTSKEDAKEEVTEDLSSELPEWARTPGVKPTRQEVESFKAPEISKPVSRVEELPEYMKA